MVARPSGTPVARTFAVVARSRLAFGQAGVNRRLGRAIAPRRCCRSPTAVLHVSAIARITGYAGLGRGTAGGDGGKESTWTGGWEWVRTRPRMGVDGKRERTRPWIGKGDHKALASGHWTLAHAVRVGGWVREGPLQGPYMLGG